MWEQLRHCRRHRYRFHLMASYLLDDNRHMYTYTLFIYLFIIVPLSAKFSPFSHCLACKWQFSNILIESILTLFLWLCILLLFAETARLTCLLFCCSSAFYQRNIYMSGYHFLMCLAITLKCLSLSLDHKITTKLHNWSKRISFIDRFYLSADGGQFNERN